jgi:hypothetical protein
MTPGYEIAEETERKKKKKRNKEKKEKKELGNHESLKVRIRDGE